MTGPWLHIPVLTFPDEPEAIISTGIGGVLLDGEPFPFASVGKWRIDIGGDDEATTLTVSIAVKIGGSMPALPRRATGDV